MSVQTFQIFQYIENLLSLPSFPIINKIKLKKEFTFHANNKYKYLKHFCLAALRVNQIIFETKSHYIKKFLNLKGYISLTSLSYILKKKKKIEWHKSN